MISENFFNFYQKKIEPVEFEKIGNLNENMNLVDDSFFANETDNVIIDYSDNTTVNEMIVDIVYCYKYFEKEIKACGLEEYSFKEDLYKILSLFLKYRPDISYSKELTFISSFILLTAENYYSAFVMMSNVVINGYLGKFLMKDSTFVSNNEKLNYLLFN